MQAQAERELLLVEEDELLAIADFIGRYGEQLAARCRAEPLELVGIPGTRDTACETIAHEVHELAAALASEHSPVPRFRELTQRRDRLFGGVGQVRDSRLGLGMALRTRQEVQQAL